MIRRTAKTHSANPVVLTTPQFFAALRRERLRADRSGIPFSLIVFTVELESAAACRKGRRVLAELIRRRIRDADEVGEIDGTRIGVLLPYTHEDGAEVLAHDIIDIYFDDSALRYTISTYPDILEPQVHDDVELFDRESPDTGDELAAEREARRTLVHRTPIWKRSMDLAIALVAIVVLSPLMVLAAAAIKLTSRGPVLYRQQRRGLGGRPFHILKFRTMRVDAEAMLMELRAESEQDGPAFKMTHDPRVTLAGKLLRSTCIDELPQLWNVIKGDMSLVGPRPLPVEEADACDVWHQRRLDVAPGMTCIWQTRPNRRVSFTEWMRMDIRYVQRRNLFHDLWLLLKTLPVVLLRRES